MLQEKGCERVGLKIGEERGCERVWLEGERSVRGLEEERGVRG